MFDIAWTELLVVAVIAIIVVGPKELPGMLRTFGKTFGQVRRTARDFQSTFNDALREAERQAALDDVKKDFDSVRKMDPAKDLRKTLSETKDALGEKVNDAKFPHPDVVPLNNAAETPAAPETTEAAPQVAPPAPAAGSSASDSPPQDEGAQRAAAGAERR